jgi:hypothetical protein
MSLLGKTIYIIGSMRNPRVPVIANALRAIGWDAYDDWYSSGPESDDRWQEYERARGRSYVEALNGYHAQHVFDIDKHHLDRCSRALMVMPAGKSCHLELGYTIGRGKPGYILLDGAEPERFEIMPRFATRVFGVLDEVLESLK